MFAFLYNAKDDACYYFGCWNSVTNPNLALASIGPYSRLADRLSHFIHNFNHNDVVYPC